MIDDWSLNALRNVQAGEPPAPSIRLESVGSIDLGGIYSDPRIKAGSLQYSGSAAEKAMNALTSIKDNELKAADRAINRKLGQELGRALGQDEDYMSLSSYERAGLSKELNTLGHEAYLIRIRIGFTNGLSNGWNSMPLPDYVPQHLNGVGKPASTEAAAQKMIGQLVDMQVGTLMSAKSRILDDPVMKLGFREMGTKGFSPEVTEALDFSGPDDEAMLRLQLMSYHWNRFKAGDLQLNWGGQQITYSDSMYNGFLSSDQRETQTDVLL